MCKKNCTVQFMKAFNINETRNNMAIPMVEGNDRGTAAATIEIEFENLPEQVNERDDEGMVTSFVDDDDSMSSISTASLSLLAAIDNNMTLMEFENLPKQTRDILKTIQTIIYDDDISFDSEAARDILQYIAQANNNNPR